MTAPTLLIPSSESVAVAWLSGLLPVGVATTLPKPGAWSVLSTPVQGFATVTVVGGATRDTALRSPVISVGTWANVPGSDRPQRGAALHLAELVIVPCFRVLEASTVRPSAKYELARVHSVRLNAEPRFVPDQDESISHFETEIVLMWTNAGEDE